MKNLHSQLFAVAVAFALLSQTGAKGKFDFSTDIGVVALQENGSLCLSIKKADIPRGTTVMIVSPFVQEGVLETTLLTGEVISRIHGPCDIPEAAEYGDSCYSVHISDGTIIKSQPYFAILTSPSSLVIQGKEVVGDLDGDGTREHFRECTSNEGVHFTVWTGTPLKGIRRWHRYFYLGYDVEPTCTDADYSDE